MKTKEELHLVMTASPPLLVPSPAYEPAGYHIQENLKEEGMEYTGYSTKLFSKDILDDHSEEKQITEAEKN